MKTKERATLKLSRIILANITNNYCQCGQLEDPTEMCVACHAYTDYCNQTLSLETIWNSEPAR